MANGPILTATGSIVGSTMTNVAITNKTALPSWRVAGSRRSPQDLCGSGPVRPRHPDREVRGRDVGSRLTPPRYLTTREPSGRFGPASHTHFSLLFNLVQFVVRNVVSVSRLKYTRTVLPACTVLPMSSHRSVG